MTRNVDAIRRLFRVSRDNGLNLPSLPGIFPDYPAPVVRQSGTDRELAMMRWGMPSSQRALMEAAKKRAQKLEAKGKSVDFKELLRLEPDSGTTNIRNVTSAHWKRWLGPDNRCLIPFTSFSEYDTVDGKKVPVWFAPDESRPLLSFAGLWTDWTSVRKAKEGEVTADVFGFLTTEPNAEVGRVHPKAMPVILTTAEEHDTWLRAPWNEAQALQRPLADGALQIVARGERKDEAEFWMDAETSRTKDVRATEVAADAIDRSADPSASPIEQADRKRRLLRGPEEFRDARLDRPNGKS